MSLSSFNPNAPPFTSSFPSFSPFTPISSPDHTMNKSRTGSHTHSRSSHSHSQSQNITPLPDLDESKSASTPSTESPPLPTPGTNPRAAPWTGISGSTVAARLASTTQIGPVGHNGEYVRGGQGQVGRSDNNQDRSERTRSFPWQSTGLGLGMGPIAPPVHRSSTQAVTSRSALGDLNLNLTAEVPTVTPSLGLASPFTPADPNGVWGPPPPMPSAAPSRQPTVEERLAQAEEKIRRLTLENQQLRSTSPPSPRNLISAVSSYSNSNLLYNVTSSPVLPLTSPFAESVTRPGYGGYAPPRMRFDELDSYGSHSAYSDDRSDPSNDSVPSPALVASVLQGTFDYSQMHHAYIRPIVWVVAHPQPRNNSESAGLKTAVNALATRLTLPRDSEPVIVLIDAILEWAKALCFTSCGNYLCQQLLEKGEADDKRKFIQEIKDDLVVIASDKFGTHVLCKAVAVKELEDPIAEALIQHGIFESFKTGARRLWREYLEKCRQSRSFDIFIRINEEMEGKWADLACANENGSIAVQQVFEVFGSSELMQPCFQELLAEVSRVANNQFGHFVLTKLVGYPPLYRPTCDAILAAYPPVAISHHGVNFAKIALTEGGRASIVEYIEAICNTEDGRTPGIVAIATSSIGKTHLTFVLGCLTPSEHVRVRQVCRAFSTTLRNSQSGNDLLRSLGLINAPGSRHRMGL